MGHKDREQADTALFDRDHESRIANSMNRSARGTRSGAHSLICVAVCVFVPNFAATAARPPPIAWRTSEMISAETKVMRYHLGLRRE
jgi:hypothetical protein